MLRTFRSTRGDKETKCRTKNERKTEEGRKFDDKGIKILGSISPGISITPRKMFSLVENGFGMFLQIYINVNNSCSRGNCERVVFSIRNEGSRATLVSFLTFPYYDNTLIFICNRILLTSCSQRVFPNDYHKFN